MVADSSCGALEGFAAPEGKDAARSVNHQLCGQREVSSRHQEAWTLHSLCLMNYVVLSRNVLSPLLA